MASGRKFLRFACLAFLLIFAMGFSPIARAGLMVGVGKTDITPPLGTPLRGYYYERLATDVHDPLFARALVIKSGENTLVLVIVDNVDVAPTGFVEARKLIKEEYSLPESNIVISATHTHTGPAYYDEYEKMLAVKIYDAVKIAMQNLQPAVIKSGVGREGNISFNRRYLMKDGTVRFNPGVLNPDIVRPVGPIDPDVGILYFETTCGKPIAVLVNFAMHLDTVGGTEISADYPYFMGKVLKKLLGDGTMVFFGLGTCGNINHINVKSPETLKGFGRTERIGYALAASVIRELPALAGDDVRHLVSKSETLSLKIPEYTPEQVEQAKINARKKSDNEASTPEIREAMKILRIQERHGKPIEAEVQVFGLGDVGIVALPGEIFVELGLQIKERSPFKHTLILTLANNSIGYIPTAEAFKQGAYEVEVSRITAGEGERLAETAVRLLKMAKEP